MTRRKECILWSGIIIVTMIIFYYFSLSLKFGAWYARITIISSGVLALIALISSLRQKEEGIVKYSKDELEQMSTSERAFAMGKMEDETPLFSRDIALVMIVSFSTALLWKTISFVFAGFIALVIMFLAKKLPIVKSLIVAAVTVCVLMYVFGNLFKIPLPSPSWWSIY